MKIGVAYPTREVPADPDKIRQFVRAAEDRGFEYINHSDHVLSVTHENRNPPLTGGSYNENDSFCDPFVFFSFAAALTDRLGFVTGVMVLPQRQTALVAKQAADLDLLSKGRFRLGVGLGWNYVEFEAMGQAFRTRARRIEEQIELLRKLWTEKLVDYQGEFHRVERAGINPLPSRPIPIWYGGYMEPGFARGARLGDGFLFAANREHAVSGLARVQHYLREFGRDEAGYGKELLVMFEREADEVAATLNAWRAAGGTHGCFDTMDRGFGADISAHIAFMSSVIAKV
jgi:probable F420-dependent oxidoreductase